MKAQAKKFYLHSEEAVLSINQRAFVIYVRTQQFLKTRLSCIDAGKEVHIPMDEIVSRFFSYPRFNCKLELQKLAEAGQLQITVSISPKTGYRIFTYEVLHAGKVDLYLIKPRAGNYDPEIRQMIEQLKHVTVDEGAPELPPYFDSFLNFRDDCMTLFVSVDEFAGRVHTPISNLHRPIRPYLLINGMPTIGIDVTTMQPLLLGKILKQVIGTNEYSIWIEEGEDIYIKLQQKARLETRDQGKKRFFEILFAKPNNELTAMFGSADWITWINQYKTKTEPNNPHNAEKPHSNLAWLLQTTEVKVMRKVWHQLINAGIPFLSVHDEIIVKQSDRQQAEQIFRAVMDQEFVFYKLNEKQAITGTQRKEKAVMPQQTESMSHGHKLLFMPPPKVTDTKHNYIGSDGMLYTHYPGLPDLI
jgi:hypothetical protein